MTVPVEGLRVRHPLLDLSIPPLVLFFPSCPPLFRRTQDNDFLESTMGICIPPARFISSDNSWPGLRTKSPRTNATESATQCLQRVIQMSVTVVEPPPVLTRSQTRFDGWTFRHSLSCPRPSSVNLVPPSRASLFVRLPGLRSSQQNTSVTPPQQIPSAPSLHHGRRMISRLGSTSTVLTATLDLPPVEIICGIFRRARQFPPHKCDETSSMGT